RPPGCDAALPAAGRRAPAHTRRPGPQARGRQQLGEPGRLFGGRYEVTGPLASGGMAEVLLARDRLLGRPVALKILHPEFARDRAFIERFRREAQSAASLNDPRIVSIYDWG